MIRQNAWMVLGLLCACASGHPDSAPAPLPVPDQTSAGADAPAVDSLALAPSAAPSPQDTAGLAATDPDSAADAAILEQLAEARVDSQDAGVDSDAGEAVPGGANSVGTAAVTYDIDVETYGSHARVQYYLDFFQGPARERFAIWLQRMPRYEPMIRSALREQKVPEDMVYLALIESGYSNSAVSRAHATGMWQFMKGTAKLYGLRIDSWVDERRDPVRATDAAARHLADLRDRFGSMYLAAAAYNAGAGKVGRGLRRLPDDDEEEENPDATFFRLYDTRFLRRETKDYVPKLIAAALIAKQPEKYGFSRPTDVEPMSYDSIIVPDATGLDVVARLADTSAAALRELNPQFVRLVTPPRQSSVVRLPLGSGARVTEAYASLAAKDRVSFVEHTVTRGQTVGTIARLYRVTTKLIADANPGVKLTRLRTGSRLLIPTSYVPPAPEPAARSTPARPASSAPAGATIRHRVRSGESLWSLADRFGTTIDRLRVLNALGRTESLRIGQVILVPAPAALVTQQPESSATAQGSGRTHLVRPGDTLSQIAAKYGVTLSALRAANGMTQSSVLKSGTRLTIP